MRLSAVERENAELIEESKEKIRRDNKELYI